MRKKHSPQEKTQIVLEVLQGESTLSEIASRNNVHPNLLTRWKTQAVNGMPHLFENEREKKAHPLDRNDLAIKEVTDCLYVKHPEFCYRRITKWLQKYEGMSINHKSILRHMREMGIQAIYPRPNTGKPHPTNPVYSYLLSGLAITVPNQVWSIDITYIPIRKSWLYPVAIPDWYSRCVIDRQIGDTPEIGFVLSTCENALQKASPIIMNSDDSRLEYLGHMLQKYGDRDIRAVTAPGL